MKSVRFLLVGLGNLGRRFCEILPEKNALLRRRYGLDLRPVRGGVGGRPLNWSPRPRPACCWKPLRLTCSRGPNPG